MANVVVRVDGIEQLFQKIEAATLAGLNEATELLAKAVQEEIPERSGDARNSVETTPAKVEGPLITSSVIIGKDKPVSDYIHALWKGNNQPDHYGHPVMHFEEWENGPEELRGADGYFHFTHVTHHVDANPFIERAIAKAKGEVVNTVKKNILAFFGRK